MVKSILSLKEVKTMSIFDHFINNDEKNNRGNFKDNSHSPIWRLTAYGVVQGVGFRWSVQTLAQNLGLNGTVRNNIDGTVTIELQASKEDIDNFEAQLPHNISSFARIDKIKTEKLAKVEQMHGFHVLY